MKRWLSIGLLLSLAVLGRPAPARASWVSEHCYNDNESESAITRSDARAYGELAVGEGYNWGGGCWNDNDKDDTPNAPDSSGEGADCSGLTFKTWEMKNESHKSGWTYWERLYNVHGPYTTTDYHSPESADPFLKLADKDPSTTIYMDAFAKIGHVAMLYVDSGSPFGTDLMIEALGDAYGMGKFYEAYRGQSEYVGVRREGWTDDCFPICGRAPDSLVVVP